MASAAEVQRRLSTFRNNFQAAVLRGLTIGTQMALRLSITKYMEPMSQDTRKDPPNPPPGPLARRTNRLAKTGRIITPQWSGTGDPVAGIEFGGINGVRYARIQELGGMAGRGLKSRIPPRPYGRPGMIEANVWSYVAQEVNSLGRGVMGGMWQPIAA